jgi:hypothetical protein
MGATPPTQVGPALKLPVPADVIVAMFYSRLFIGYDGVIIVGT